MNIKKEGEGPTNIGGIRSYVLSAKKSNNDKQIVEYFSHTLTFFYVFTSRISLSFGGMFELAKMNYGFISYYHLIDVCGNLCYLKTFNGNQKEESVTRP